MMRKGFQALVVLLVLTLVALFLWPTIYGWFHMM